MKPTMSVAANKIHLNELLVEYYERRIEKLEKALNRIVTWHGEFPETGEFYDEDKSRPVSYGVQYGSNGERDYMRNIALNAILEED